MPSDTVILDIHEYSLTSLKQNRYFQGVLTVVLCLFHFKVQRVTSPTIASLLSFFRSPV